MLVKCKSYSLSAEIQSLTQSAFLYSDGTRYFARGLGGCRVQQNKFHQQGCVLKATLCCSRWRYQSRITFTLRYPWWMMTFWFIGLWQGKWLIKKKTPANFRYIYYISTVISRLCVLTSILLSVISTSAITDCVLSIFPTQNCINNLSVFTQMVYPKITVYQRVPKMFLQLFGG